MKLAGQGDQRLVGLWLDVRGVDHRQATGSQKLARDIVQQVEGVIGGRLVVLVIRDQATAEIRRENFGRLEVGAGEGALASAGRANQDDQGQLRNGDLHW